MPATKPNVAALVEQMPETDKDIQLRQEEAKAVPANPADASKPSRLGAASKFTGPDPEAALKIFTEILAGGRESLLELLALVREPSDDDFKNYKAGYVLHGLVIYAGRAGNEKQHRLLVDTFAAQLRNEKHSPAVKAYLIRELRLLGGKEAVNALGSHLLDERLCGDATQALISIHDGAAAQFRTAARKASGRNRLTILQALGVLRDSESASTLKQALTDENRDVRHTAAWALANLGEPSSVDALLKSGDSAEGWDRIEANRVCLLLAERLAANKHQSQAARVYTHLRDTRNQTNERHIRDAAEKVLAK